MEDLEEFITVAASVIDLSISLAQISSNRTSSTNNENERANRVRSVLKRWVVQHGLEVTCSELLPILREIGFEGIAVYIEECMRTTSIEMLNLDNCQLTDEDAGILTNHFLRLSSSNLAINVDHGIHGSESNVNLVDDIDSVGGCDVEEESLENTQLCIQDDESSTDSEEEETNTNVDRDQEISIVKYTNAIFLASMFIAIVGLFALCGAIFLTYLSLSRDAGNNNNNKSQFFDADVERHPDPVLINATSQSPTMTEFEEKCISKIPVQNEMAAFEFDNNNGTIVVNWTEKVVNFCNNSEIHLQVLHSSLWPTSWPERITCPENVISLQLQVDAIENDVDRILQLLQIFCNLNAVQFSGTGFSRQGRRRISCEKQAEQSPVIKEIKLNSLKYIKWQNFSGCDHIYSSITSAIIAPRLARLDFTCTFLSRKNQKQTEILIARSNEFNTIRCADANLCNSLKLNSSSRINFDTRRITCD